jgi:protein-arginine kinase
MNRKKETLLEIDQLIEQARKLTFQLIQIQASKILKKHKHLEKFQFSMGMCAFYYTNGIIVSWADDDLPKYLQEFFEMCQQLDEKLGLPSLIEIKKES